MRICLSQPPRTGVPNQGINQMSTLARALPRQLLAVGIAVVGLAPLVAIVNGDLGLTAYK